MRLIVIMRGWYIKWGGTLKGWGRGDCTVTDLLPFKTLISKGKFSFAAPVHSCIFSIEVEGKSCQKYWLNSSYVIMFFYIFFFSQTTVFLYALRQRRIWHWALLQTERLKLCRNCTLTQMNQWRNWCNSSCLKWFLFGSYSQRAKNHLIH